ncbi:MAG: hydroxyacid dehydrogenase [Calditrichaeota bacterium]|nr:MAG: hydroxyacid dehydrogenase [Calditrichota bacterium]MBL1204494.1 hydroxyacid dehydrogenase [Calditrichota bacterium]NOG44323.1 hydroxyacid dehydrogenase [Calditrichota bacterium]
MKTIYFYEAFEEEEVSLKKFLPKNVEAGFTWKTIQEAGHELPPAKIISTRTQSIYPESWADKLDAIISRSTGYDHLLEYREKTNSQIRMGHLPLYCNRAVAEHALMSILVLLRKLSEQTRQFRKFERDGLTGYELQEKTLVVYGVGNIGYEMVKIGRGLDMTVFGVDIVKRHKDVKYISPEKGAQIADIIVCAMNLTKDNVDYFNEKFFQKVKKNLVFINVSRGEISPSSILLNQLENQKIAGVALDVFDHEKKLAVSLRQAQGAGKAPLRQALSADEEVIAVQKMMNMDNVLLTPHNAFNTRESVERKSQQTIEQLIFFLENNKFIWQV